jgi:glycosyltransferase involved in cell wall biosynthesis
LPAFLESINRQEAAGSFEIVLVDDGSSDGSVDVARELCSQLGPRIDVLFISLARSLPYRQETFTFRAGAARQRGVELARGEQILFLDPDQEARSDCVAQHRWWNKRGFDVVIGDRAYNSDGAYDPESIYRARMSRRSLSDCRDWWLAFYTGNSSVSRAALDAAGGFDESLQYWGLDDTDLGYRLALAGATFWYTLRACVTHVDKVESGGGASREARERSCWLLMEVLFRKYLDVEILDAYRYLWAEGRSWGDVFQTEN